VYDWSFVSVLIAMLALGLAGAWASYRNRYPNG
jgi:hypothetical protein